MVGLELINKVKKHTMAFLGRRPHRSFKLTRRRDTIRSLALPGYVKFTNDVWKLIWTNRKQFFILGLVYAVATYFLVGIVSESTFSTLSDTLNETSGELFTGGLGEVGKAGLLLLTAVTGGMSQTLTETQQISAGIIALLMWLTCIWMLRNIMAGRKVKVRDGLYNSGAPILSSFLVMIVIAFQLIPLAVALFGYGAAVSTGLLTGGGVESMMFWITASLLATLSLYWITSTFFALIVVTLPGMYPYEAIKTAGDLVVGRRFRIMLRIVWMIINMAVIWAIILIPIILFDAWIKDIWTAVIDIPIVPAALLMLGSFSIIWTSSYIYLLYRKVVSDGAKSA